MIKNGLGETDLSCISYKYINGKKIYQWKNSIGKIIQFTYKGKSGEFQIISVPRRGYIRVKYKDTYYVLVTKYVIAGALAKLFPEPIQWIYSENQRIKDHPEGKESPRDITITKRIFDKDLRKNRANKFYGYVCNKCGYNTDIDDGLINEHELKSGNGCSCCSGFKTITGINDITTKSTWILPYLVNKKDENLYWRTQKKLLMKCPKCGTEKTQSPRRMIYQGFGCNGCSDGISYGEKFISKLLEQSNITYIWQQNRSSSADDKFAWCQKYKYDFYLPDFKTIVEVHGRQHYDPGKHFFTEYENIHINDLLKKENALKNGNISQQDYVVINASESSSDFLMDSIQHSRLADVLDWNTLNVLSADRFANKSILITICEEWEKRYPKITTKMLQAEYPHLSRSTITKYLKKGTAIGICNYDNSKAVEYEHINRASRPIKIHDTLSNIEYFFKNRMLLEANFKKIFGTVYNIKRLTDALKGRIDSYYYFTFTYISKETFNKAILDSNPLHVYGDPFILEILA